MEVTLVLDPSGNHGKEGFGITGFAIFHGSNLVNFGDIKAADFASQELYWGSVSSLIRNCGANLVVCESYKLQPSKAGVQSYSTLDTPQLIGYLRIFAYDRAIAFDFVNPSDKARMADPVLESMGVLEKRGSRYYCNGQQTNDHMRDAIRHGFFYFRYRYKVRS